MQLSFNSNNKTVHCNCNTTILPRREIYLKKAFETSVNDCIWLAEGAKIYRSSFQGMRKHVSVM